MRATHPHKGQHDYRRMYRRALLLDRNQTPAAIATTTGEATYETTDMIAHISPVAKDGLAPPAVSAAQAVLLHYIWHRAFDHPAMNYGPSAEDMHAALGTETVEDAQALAASLVAAGVITSDPSEASSPHRLDQDLDPELWQGTPSSLVTALLALTARSVPEADTTAALLHLALAPDTVRILLGTRQMDEYRAIVTHNPPRPRRDWPLAPATVYAEFEEPLDTRRSSTPTILKNLITTLPPPQLHGIFLIPNPAGPELVNTITPLLANGHSAIVRDLIDVSKKAPPIRRENDPAKPKGRPTFPPPWPHADRSEATFQAVIHLLADQHRTIRPRPLTSTETMRLKLTGAPNPWHIIGPPERPV